MKSTILQIRDIEKIEKELSANKVGLLGFVDKEETLNQLVYPYLYANKNIYIFFEESDEVYSNFIFEGPVKFTIYKAENQKKNNLQENQLFYKFFQITFRGNLRQESEKKLIDELYKQYLQKYNFNESKLSEGYLDNLKLVFLDTEEIDATEVTGA